MPSSLALLREGERGGGKTARLRPSKWDEEERHSRKQTGWTELGHMPHDVNLRTSS